jgi:hypothetical protein
MKAIASVVALVLLAGPIGCSQADANPLIGTWKLDPSSNPDKICLGTMTFTATTYTAVDPWGKLSTIPVRYVGGDVKSYPADVYLITDAGVANHVTYRFESPNKMSLQAYTVCAYIRA